MCETIKELIDLYVSGDLSGAEARKVEKHLDGCESCRKEAAVYRARLEDLGSLAAERQPDVLPPFFWQGIQREILLEEERRKAGPLSAGHTLRKRVLALAAAVLLAATAYLVYALVSGYGSGVEPAATGGLVVDEAPSVETEDGGVLLPPGRPLVPRRDVMPGARPEEETLKF